VSDQPCIGCQFGPFTGHTRDPLCPAHGAHRTRVVVRVPKHNLDIPEAKLQEITLAHVNRIPGVRVWRMNTGGAKTPTGFVHYGEPGQGDLAGLMAPSGRRLEIELKAKRGRLRDAQRDYGARIAEYGGLYIVARSLIESVRPICDALGYVCEEFDPLAERAA